MMQPVIRPTMKSLARNTLLGATALSIALLSAPLAVHAQGANGAQGQLGRIAAIVNEEPITVSDVEGRLQLAIVSRHGRNSVLAQALGKDVKGKLSLAAYLAAIPGAFFSPWISMALFVLVALIWLVPDKRIEQALREFEEAEDK